MNSQPTPKTSSKVGQCDICRDEGVKVWTIKGADYCYECKEWILKMKAEYEQAAAKRLKDTADVKE